jgi:phage-related baseplate assembly protein
MSAFSAIDLSKVPVPSIIEALDYETILAAMLADLQARQPTFTALLESDPAYKVLEVAAYRELILRQRVNDAAKAVMLAYSISNDLDNLGALFNVTRLVITPANPDAIPPVVAVMESDSSLRIRIQFAMEGLSNAGSSGAYIYHALSASALVKDVSVDHVTFHVLGGLIVIDSSANLLTPEPGMVAVSVLSTVGNGAASDTVLTLVTSALNDESVRPLTDKVVVRSAEIVNYTIAATLYFYDGPSSATVLTAAQNAIAAYVADSHKLGRDIAVSGIYAALHQSGVHHVVLTTPVADVAIANYQAGYCTAITLTNGGVGV